MKRFALAFALIAAAAPSFAAGTASCDAIQSRIAQQAGAFVKINGAATVQKVNATPADFQRALARKNAKLQEITDNVWVLRAEMAYRNCQQAAAYTY